MEMPNYNYFKVNQVSRYSNVSAFISFLQSLSFIYQVGRERGREEATHSFSSGDMVQVSEGELVNLKGKVLTVDGNTILILPKHEDLTVRISFHRFL